eukprot:374034-Amphidinium_carterae.1
MDRSRTDMRVCERQLATSQQRQATTVADKLPHKTRCACACRWAHPPCGYASRRLSGWTLFSPTF